MPDVFAEIGHLVKDVAIGRRNEAAAIKDEFGLGSHVVDIKKHGYFVPFHIEHRCDPAIGVIVIEGGEAEVLIIKSGLRAASSIARYHGVHGIVGTLYPRCLSQTVSAIFYL